jgi:protein-tyrosine-phosphatase/predicted ATP-grasp superfamily ATP-dependent carboligase
MTFAGKALVLGDDTRSFLATVRSLGRQGIEVHAAPFDMTAPALQSRYIQRTQFLPYYLDGGGEWLTAMKALLLAERYDLVIPCEERSLLPLFVHRAELEALTVLAIPDERALDAFFDKHRTRELAGRLNIPVAKGRLLAATDSVAAIEAELGLPLIAKPRKSYVWPDIYVRNGARLIERPEDVAALLEKHADAPDEILLEKLFPGCGLGVSVLCHEGAVLQAFEHRRAHELFGSSYYRRSVAVDPQRLAAVSAFVSEVAYTGLAMFEFKLDEANGEWILLEVNARPWGSLPLPVSIGVDFPYRLYQLQVKGQLTAAVAYPAERYARNFVLDLWQLRSVLGEWRKHPATSIAQMTSWLWGFRRWLTGKETFDVWVSDDSKPAKVELRQFITERAQAVLGRTSRSAARGTLREKLAERLQGLHKDARILFICQGNICRSPYAEYKFRQLLPADAPLVVQSAGLLPRNRRGSPQGALVAAEHRGVDLSSHKSLHASRELVENADVIFLFDEINALSFERRYPGLVAKTFPLDVFSRVKTTSEIHDPEGKSVEVFSVIYDEIDDCLNGVVSALNDRMVKS